MNFQNLGHRAVDLAKSLGASYAEFRFEEITNENVELADGKPGQIDRNVTAGFNVRVLVDGAWGFSADFVTNEAGVEAAARQAVEIARTSARINKYEVRLAPVEAVRDGYRTPVKIDPFTIPLKEKIDRLRAIDALMIAVPEVNSRTVFMSFRKIE